MKKNFVLIALLSLFLVSCTAVKPSVTNQYKLAAFSAKQYAKRPSQYSILVSTPEAVAGYQTEQMMYVNKPYALASFVKNAWIDPPAEMLFPLIVQSLQKTQVFKAVGSSPHAEITDYRLDTQLIELQQNFLRKPSQIDLVVKVVLTRVTDSKVIASRIIAEHVICPSENPEGGVFAANRAVEKLTQEITHFVISHIKNS